MACKAQKRSVSDDEVERYKKYDAQYGARYVDDGNHSGAGGEALQQQAMEDDKEEEW